MLATFSSLLFSSSVSCFVIVYLDSVNVESCSSEVFLSMCYLYLEEPKVSDNGPWLFRFCDSTVLRAKSPKNAPNKYFTHPKLAWPVACTLLCSPKCTRCRTQEVLFSEKRIIYLVSFYWTCHLYFDSPKYGPTRKNIQGYNKVNWLRSIYLFGVLYMSDVGLMEIWTHVWLIGGLRVHNRMTEITGKSGEVQNCTMSSCETDEMSSVIHKNRSNPRCVLFSKHQRATYSREEPTHKHETSVNWSRKSAEIAHEDKSCQKLRGASSWNG